MQRKSRRGWGKGERLIMYQIYMACQQISSMLFSIKKKFFFFTQKKENNEWKGNQSNKNSLWIQWGKKIIFLMSISTTEGRKVGGGGGGERSTFEWQFKVGFRLRQNLIGVKIPSPFFICHFKSFGSEFTSL